MALVKCRECGREVSTEAKACPGCGAIVKKQRKEMGCLPKILIALFVFAVVGHVITFNHDQELARVEAAKPPEQRAAEKAEKDKRNTQDALAINGAKALKRAMKDPDSFKLESLIVQVDGSACYSYRAKNSFGAVTPGWAVQLPNGKMLTDDTNGSDLSAAWNKRCSGKSGRSVLQIAQMMGVV